MARCYTDAAANLEVRRGEINFLSATLADVKDVDTLFSQAIDQGRLYGFRGETNIVTHDDSVGLNDLGVALTYPLSDVFIELIGNAPADIIRFKTANRFWHGALLKNSSPWKQLT